MATGKGDELSSLSLALQKYRIVLVKPEIHVNTVEAYTWVTPRKGIFLTSDHLFGYSFVERESYQ
ncbi:MAG: hypothetical protein R2759_02895 [Bacteroidales bacterium]